MEEHTTSVDDIYLAALERESIEERSAYLDDACAGNSELRRRVERLLEVQLKIGSFLESPAPELCPTSNHPITEKPGVQIGPYKLLQQVGEGGMGVVFMAEQSHPVRRTVALKIIKPGMDTRQVIARFEAERQALAMMDHSNIARVLDAGTTETNRPYFVMELVKGIPITNYCDNHRLTPRQRLELFIPVCQAVQHAHQKGVIHRDLKPSNVMIALYDGRPVPKVIDFGVAKATGSKLTEKTLFTEFGAVLGTLEYMSPEQAELNQLDVDTRSDIYTLGVMLYELLTGTTPLEHERVRETALYEVLRVIREDEPPKPSTRITTTSDLPSIAENRGMEPKRLSGLVRGELDWIVMKALEKNRNRRYETANGLIRDIERYLNDEQVQACPPSAAYRFRKLAKRHKAVLLTAAIIAVSLVLGTVVSLWQATLARRAEALAQSHLAAEMVARQQVTDEAVKATTISGLLQKALQSANPDEAKGADYTVRELLDDFSARLGDQLQDQPENAAAIQATVGNAYRGLGLPDKAEPHLKAALDLRRRIFGPDDAHVARSLSDYAWCFYERRDTANLAEAEKQVREALAIHRKLGLRNSDTVELLSLLQLILSQRHPTEEAKQAGEEALEIASKLAVQPPEVANVLHRLAEVFLKQNEPDPVHAEALARESVALHRKLHGDNHPQTGWGLYVLGWALQDQGKYQEAEQSFREALAIFLKQYDDSHVSAQLVLERLERVLEMEHDQAALKALRADKAARIKQRMQHNPADVELQTAGAEAIFEAGDFDESIALLNDIISKHPDLAKAWDDRGGCYRRKGEYSKAVEDYSQAIKLNPHDYWSFVFRGIAYLELGEHEKSIADYSKAIELDESQGVLWCQRGYCYCRLSQWDKADADLAKAIELAPERPEMPWSRALIRLALHDDAGCHQVCEALVERATHSSNENFALYASFCTFIPGSVVNPDKVLSLTERACKSAPHNPLNITMRGAALYRASRFDEAKESLIKAIHTYEKSDPPSGIICYDYLFLAMVCQQLDEPDEAHACLDRAVQIIEESPSAVPQHKDIQTWDDRLCLSSLRKEAEQLLSEGGMKPTNTEMSRSQE